MKNERKQVFSSKVLLAVAASFFIGCPDGWAIPATPISAVASVMQSSVVKGTVVDANGESIIGASVVVKSNTTIGSITDLDGKFELSNVPPQGVLVVSYVGYQTQEISYSGNQPLRIVLKEDTEMLDEVVVVGYGTQKKATLSGSVTSVGGEKLAQTPVTNVSQGLAGRLPGVVAVSNTSEPGYDGATITIRGVNTFPDFITIL